MLCGGAGGGLRGCQSSLQSPLSTAGHAEPLWEGCRARAALPLWGAHGRLGVAPGAGVAPRGLLRGGWPPISLRLCTHWSSEPLPCVEADGRTLARHFTNKSQQSGHRSGVSQRHWGDPLEGFTQGLCLSPVQRLGSPQRHSETSHRAAVCCCNSHPVLNSRMPCVVPSPPQWRIGDELNPRGPNVSGFGFQVRAVWWESNSSYSSRDRQG